MTKYLSDTPITSLRGLFVQLPWKYLLSFLLASVVFAGSAIPALAASCELTISYTNVAGTISESFYTNYKGAKSNIDNFSLPLDTPVTFTINGSGFTNSDRDQCNDSYLEVDLATGGAGAGLDAVGLLGGETRENVTCQSRADGTMTATMTYTFDMEDLSRTGPIDTQAIIVKLRDKQGGGPLGIGNALNGDDDLCAFEYPVDPGDHFFENERGSGVECYYTEQCPGSGGTIRQCQGKTKDDGTCGPGVYAVGDESPCSECFACGDFTDAATQECPMGCNTDTAGDYYSAACEERLANPNLPPVCNNNNGIMDSQELTKCVNKEFAGGVGTGPSSGAWILCEQAGEFRTQCLACKPDMWTTFGCIPTDYKAGIAKISTIILGMVGGLGLLRILLAAFYLSISRGDPKQTDEAKQMIEATVIGLLFIVFSISILQFIGVDILAIPGFGE